MATHSSIFAWRIPWTEESGGLWSIGSQRVRHDWSDLACRHKTEIKIDFLLLQIILFKIWKLENGLDHGSIFFPCEIEISAHVVKRHFTALLVTLIMRVLPGALDCTNCDHIITWEHKSQWSMTFSLWLRICREETQNGKRGWDCRGPQNISFALANPRLEILAWTQDVAT